MPVVWTLEDGEIVWDAASLRALLPSRVHGLVPRAPIAEVVTRATDLATWAIARRGPLGAEDEARVVALRDALVGAPEDAYLAARDAVAALVEGADDVALGLLAAAFTAEREWTHRAVRAHLARGARPARLTELLGPFVTDPSLATELAIATAPSPRALFPRALDVVAHLRGDAVAPLRAMLLHRFSDASMDGVARALGRIGTDAAGRVLLPLAAVRGLRPRARSWAKRHPERAIPILEALIAAPTDEALDLAESSDIASSLEALLGELRPPPLAPAEPWPAATPPALRDGPIARPDFLVLGRLPRVALPDGTALPATATLRLAAILARADRAALEDVKRACDRASLAALAMALFEQWLAHGAEPREGWAIDALGALGQDDQIAALLPHLAEWQGRGGARRAGRLLDAIASLGTEAALLELDRVARKDRYRKLRARARVAVARAGAALGLTGEELEDRLAPTLGLDPRGATRLDLGGRTVEVVLDEGLRPLVRVGGRRGRRFPERRAGDDPARHAAAAARFRELRAQAALVADQQVARLERMMVEERSVSREDFGAYFVGHPLVRHLVERLVWSGPDRAFRVADDGRLTGADDEPVALAPGARVRLLHPLAMRPAERARWGEVFADYELAQPFAQLGRRTFDVAPAERAAGRLLGLEEREVPWPALVRLVRAGFVGSTRDGLRYTSFEGAVAGGALTARLEATPGLHVGDPTGSGPQRILRITIEGLAAASPVRASEAYLALAVLFDA